VRVNDERPVFFDEPGEAAWRASTCCRAPLAWSVVAYSAEVVYCLGCGRRVTEWTVLSAAGPPLRATTEQGATDGTCEACETGKPCCVQTMGRAAR